jgi:EmrB/QacA subfamily drug resistance transporter
MDSQATADAAPFQLRSIMMPLLTIIIGLFMVILDATAVNVALPTLVKDFHVSLTSLQWVLTGYMLAQAAVIPLAGWLSDRFGAKRVFLTAIALFTLGSALCAVAQSNEMLIAFRILQGLGGGCLMPIGMAYTYRLSPPDKRGVVMGTIGIPILFAPAVGPTVSGWLVEYASWRWIFSINLPIGLFALWLGLRKLPHVDTQAAGDLDLPGMILGPLAFSMLSYGVSEGATSWTSVNTLGGLIGGAVALVAFVLVELRASKPLLEMRVFKSIDFSIAVVAQWVGQIALFGGIFLVPLFLQQVRLYGPFDTGMVMMAQALTAAAFMPIGGRLFDKIGARPLVAGGLGLVGLGTFLLTRLSGSTTETDLIFPLMLRGAGMALMMMPLNTHILNSAPRKLVSRVTSLTAALQSVVNSLAIAGLSTVLASRASFHQATALLNAPHGTAAPAHQATGLPAPIANLFASAFSDTIMVAAVISFAGALLGLTLRKRAEVQTTIQSSAVPEEPLALEMAG